MSNKTCGKCKHFPSCIWPTPDTIADNCEDFEQKPITNGDVIRQKSNEELVMILTGEGCKYCIYRGVNFRGFTVTCRYPDKTRIPDCSAGILAWFNAPAESEGEDE